MAKSKSVYICNNCGYETPKWYGKCPSCNEWNCMEESVVTPVTPLSKSAGHSKLLSANSLEDIKDLDEIRYLTGMTELDRVLGGGVVKGSVILLGGDPGIGKSTLLLQICEYLGIGLKILYVSGEESARQIKLRAQRLGVTTSALSVMCETDAMSIIEYINSNRPDIVIVDSIQTMSLDGLSSSPGSVTQVRECTSAFLRIAKSLDIPFLIVGHVNKDGAIAGPKVLEHIVDAVLYFEGERNHTYRILRAVKNRYGSTNEIGVFEMYDKGLMQVENPSEMLLSGRPEGVAGSCVASVIEGSRPIMTEVQGLVSQTNFGNPRRMSNGFDYNRLNMLLAVLEKRAGYFLGNFDVYVNVVGGLRLDDPAADLTVALAVISSLKDVPVREDAIALGELGLSGEIRSIGNISARVNEAVRLGFKHIIIPYNNLKMLDRSKISNDASVFGVRNIREAFDVAISQ